MTSAQILQISQLAALAFWKRVPTSVKLDPMISISDLVQEAAVELFKRLPDIQGAPNPEALAYSIATGVCMNHARPRVRHGRTQALIPEVEHNARVEERINARQILKRLLETKALRAADVLSVLAGEPMESVTKRAGVTRGTILNNMAALRKQAARLNLETHWN